MFQIQNIDRRTFDAVEPLGTKAKFWFTANDRRMLFKAEERGTGEDWAEKIARHLCELLGLPHIHYELAEEYEGSKYIRPGVICENCAPPPMALVLGNQLLLQRDPAYPADEKRKYKVREHTVTVVAAMVGDLLPPRLTGSAFPDGVQSALDVFMGYIMLDAWIANQDRHLENWAALRDGTELRLAPTYDHGASLARQITDDERKERLETKDRGRSVAFFAQKARSAFYADSSDAHALGTLEAYNAFANLSPAAAVAWRNRLASVNQSEVKHLLDEVPNKRMSSITKSFTLELLEENRRRLLQGCRA